MDGDFRDIDEAWQDGLDLAACAAGLKPLALVPLSFADRAARAGLRASPLAPWLPAAPDDLLPRWYLDAVATRRARRRILAAARENGPLARAAELSRQGRVSVADEAEILGYPACCVAWHHRAALAHERAVADAVARANHDEAARVRLVAAGAVPFVPAQEIAPSRWTSVNLCGACVADAASPARDLERRYAALAEEISYPRRA
jgi:hypothetical protein